MRPIRVINLARHAQRREAFLERNPHLPVSFFDGIDGRMLTAEQIDSTGLFTREVRATYDAHGYGCALSHWHLWKEAAESAEPLTIAEDDAAFRHDFEARSQEVLAALPADWDIVLWGWNFDSVLHVQPMGGVSPVVMLFDQKQLRKSVPAFQALETPVQPLRLHKAFGLVAYTLSPRGAARLLKLCFPQKPQLVFVPVFGHHMHNIGVDASTNAVYGDTHSYACFPPLVVTPNVRGDKAATAESAPRLG